MKRFLHYFRIAFTAFCGLVAVLLCVMWVRSYSCSDVFNGPGTFSINTATGVIHVERLRPIFTSRWSIYTFDLSWRQDGFSDRPYASRIWDGFDIDDYGVRFPIWFAALVTSLVATIPWIRWRFRLRTLLIATTLVAMVLGLVVWLR